jgi:hypothetical protein
MHVHRGISIRSIRAIKSGVAGQNPSIANLMISIRLGGGLVKVVCIAGGMGQSFGRRLQGLADPEEGLAEVTKK